MITSKVKRAGWPRRVGGWPTLIISVLFPTVDGGWLRLLAHHCRCLRQNQEPKSPFPKTARYESLGRFVAFFDLTLGEF